MDTRVASKKLGLKERYAAMTRGLGWETTYQPMDKVFPYDKYEGIKIHDWDKWQDPFRLTMDAYWKYQGEKEKKLYAVIEAFAQNNGQLGVTDARYINALKLFIQGVTPLEYYAHRGFAHVGRQFTGEGARVAAQMQSVDELRHYQTETHAISHYNKYFNGMHHSNHWFDRVWYLSVPKSFFEDACTGGPFEFLTAVSFSFEYVLTNLLFVPFMSGAAHNGDMSTVTFGFSRAERREPPHDAGHRVHQVPAGAGPGQRAHRAALDRQVVLARLPPADPGRHDAGLHAAQARDELEGSLGDVRRRKRRRPVQGPCALRHPRAQPAGSRPAKARTTSATRPGPPSTTTTVAAPFHTWVPKEEELAWLSREVPRDTFDKYYRPRWEFWRDQAAEGKRFYNMTLPHAVHHLPDSHAVHRRG